MIKVLGFGRLGESLGPSTEFSLPAHVVTVADLLAWLATLGPVWQQEMQSTFRVAVNQDFVSLESRVVDGDEVLLLPRVSGG